MPTSRNIVRFTPTADDLAAAYRRQHLARLWSWASLVSGVTALLLVAAFLVLAAAEMPLSVKGTILACAILGGLLVPLAMIRWRVPALARRIYRQQRTLHGEVTVEWDAAGLRSVTEAGESRIPWANYHRWREDAAVILLYHSDVVFQFIPKRALTAAQATALRGLVAAAGVRGAAPGAPR